MRKLKIFILVLFSVSVMLALRWVVFLFNIYIHPPSPANYDELKNTRTEVAPGVYVCKNNWLRLSETGLWELYIEGEAFERGAMTGILTKELIDAQEKAFIDEIQKMVPSSFYLTVLKYFVAWFNRDVTTYIPEEYQLEIFGISESASNKFSNVGPSYLRFLNYHGAHDIGHSLQNMGMVGCTSFAVKDEASEDSLLIIGRNFDFYVGDDFAKNKIVAFVRPEHGYKFMYVTWGGMIGVVSGMNEQGLTITINAARSGIPLKAKTPVSIVAREVLQYAQNIEEAYAIIAKRETFVAESFFVGSAQDNKAVIIEKSTDTTVIYDNQTNTVICANHFQSPAFENDALNKKAIETSSSVYRQQRVQELISELQPLNYLKSTQLLRDRFGLDGKDIGIGNEKSINQLIAHHSIIFIPQLLQVWVSAPPYQLGRYITYDLNTVFSISAQSIGKKEIYSEEFIIPEDPFLHSEQYKQFVEYKKFKELFLKKLNCRQCNMVTDEFIEYFISLNPEFYYVYALSGEYFQSKKKYSKAIEMYEIALTKEITTVQDEERIRSNLETCKKEQ